VLVSRIGSSAEARPHDRRVWSGGSHGSVVRIPDLGGLGNAPGSRDGHGIEPSAQPPFGGDLVS
jgi:hypothetical protein